MSEPTVSQTTLDFIAAHTSDVILRADREGRVMYISPSVRAFGYDPAELLGQFRLDLIHPDDRARFIDNSKSLLEGRIAPQETRQFRLRTAQGEWVWLEGNPGLVVDERGELVEFVNVFRDVTRRHDLEAEAREQAMLFEAAFHHSTVGNVQVGLDGQLLRANATFCRFIGYTEAELRNLNLSAISHPSDNEAERALVARLHAGEVDRLGRDKRYIRADGTEVWAHAAAALVRDASGRPRYYIAQVQDLTERRLSEAALEAAMAAAQSAANVKAQFLANMSHEIRTPLTAVLGFAELLAKRDAMDDRARAYIDRIEASGRALLAIVNDILDFSKLEAGRFEVRPRPSDVIETCGETLPLFQQQAEAKGLALAFEAAEGVPPLVSIDDDRLRQMLINLVGNAVKFTDAGQVVLRVAPGAAPDWIALEVADTGPGLEPEAQALLFQRFTQIDGTMARRHGGTGLGLAICRGVAEAMGGRIAVESVAGRGSTFRLDLPAPPAEPLAGEAGPEPELDVAGLRVMVVDDNGGNRELARVMLTAAGVDVRETADGRTALQDLAATPVNLVLMDLRMPGLDGHETLAALRAGGGPNAATPVLAFTADADLSGEGDLAGFDGLVRKPIRRKEMLAAVARAAGCA